MEGRQNIAPRKPDSPLQSRSMYLSGTAARSGIIKHCMRRIRLFWRSVYDVRPGEGVRTLFMALHMLCVLFAYYILKPVSQALFLSKFDIDQLPVLQVLIA